MSKFSLTTPKRLLIVVIVLVVSPFTTYFTQNTQANPEGANVVSGIVGFDGLGTNNLTINQSSNTAIIDWQRFNIGLGDTTTFVQPGVNSLAVNRVISGDPSSIYGTLSSNGSIVLINPNGILVGSGGLVDVRGALTLSTLDADNQDFLNGGAVRYFGSGNAGVDIRGSIYARDAILLGDTVVNDGSINATRSVAIAAGSDILLEQSTSGATVSVRSNGTINSTNPYADAINNNGVIRATGYQRSGGRVVLKAGSNSGVINQGGIYAQQLNGAGGQVEIEAGVVDLANGIVDASGSNGQVGGSVTVSATDVTSSGSAINVDGNTGGSINIDATNSTVVSGDFTARGTAGVGGQIDISGNTVDVGPNTLVDVSGYSGGRARVGGSFQGVSDNSIRNSVSTNIAEDSLFLADGSRDNAGTVIIWSDYDTTFYGEVSAQALGNVGNGGLVEISGKDTLTFSGEVSTQAVNGSFGTLLLDPTDVTIVNGARDSANELSDTTLNAALRGSNVVIQTSGNGGDEGNVTFETGSLVVWSNGLNAPTTSLTVLAHNDINVNGSIRTDDLFVGGQLNRTGNGNINLVAGWSGLGLNPDNALTLGNEFEQASTGFVNFDDTIGVPNLDGIRLLQRNIGQGVVRVSNSANINNVEIGSEGGQVNILAGEVIITGTGLTGIDGDGNPVGFDASIGISEVFANFANSQGQINVIADGDITLVADAGSARIGNINAPDAAGQLEGSQFTNDDQNAFANGTFTNNITVRAGDSGTGILSLSGGSTAGALAQIGHRVRDSASSTDGTIDVFARNGIELTAGTAVDTSSSIGHYSPDATGANISGDITVSVTNGNINANSSAFTSAFTSIGHGHGLDSESFEITQVITAVDIDGDGAVDNLLDLTGDGINDFFDTDDDGLVDFLDLNGDTVNEFVDTNGDGRPDFFDSNFDGVNDFVDVDGDGFHDAFQTGLFLTGDTSGGQTGSINVAASGDITLNANNATLAFSSIGGFAESTSNREGDISITSSNVILNAGAGTASGTIGSFSSIGFVASSQADVTSNIEVDVSSSVDLNAGLAGLVNFARIGHSGLTTEFDARFAGDIAVNAPLLELTGGGGSLNNSSIGHGATNNRDSIEGNISLTGTELNLLAGTGEDAYVRVGHGGSTLLDAPITGNVSLAYTGPITLTGGTGDVRSFAQIGHGGAVFEDPLNPDDINPITGNITVASSNGSISLNSGTVDNFTAIGHGGINTNTSIEGNIVVTSGADVELSGLGENAYAAIGHGGVNSNGTKLGNISVTADNIGLTGGSGFNSHALIGINAVGGQAEGTENVSVSAAGTVTNIDANVTVTARDDVNLIAGVEGFAQIGHASLDTSDTILTGTTRVTTGGNLTLTGDPSVESFAKIGHGDRDLSSAPNSGSEWSGDIFVRVGDDLTVNDGLIGHSEGGNLLSGAPGRISAHSLVESSGDTIIEVSRNNPDTFGAEFLGVTQGVLTTDANTTFSAPGELRIAVPNREENQIADGTLLNDVFYVNPGNDEVSLDLGNALGDENLNFDGALTFLALEFGQAAPVYSANDRNGGNYQLYYNSVNSLNFASRGQQIINDNELFERFDDPQMYFDNRFVLINTDELSINNPEIFAREAYRSTLRRAVVANNGRRYILYPDDEESEAEEEEISRASN